MWCVFECTPQHSRTPTLEHRFNCKDVDCATYELLPLKDLEVDAIRYTPQECCDSKVTTCRQELDKSREFCGAGRVPRQDELDVLIYNDEAPERCCEKETYV